jgi:hypothetical protein
MLVFTLFDKNSGIPLSTIFCHTELVEVLMNMILPALRVFDRLRLTLDLMSH